MAWYHFKKTENVICYFQPCGMQTYMWKENKTFENSFLIQMMFLTRNMQQIGVAYAYFVPYFYRLD